MNMSHVNGLCCPETVGVAAVVVVVPVLVVVDDSCCCSCCHCLFVVGVCCVFVQLKLSHVVCLFTFL